MRRLTERDRRIVKWASVAIVGYLVLFYGIDGWQRLEAKLDDVARLELAARDFEVTVTKELKKHKRLKQLQKEWGIDLDALEEQTIVSEARDAIQAAAKANGVGLGSSQEIGRRTTAKEIRVIQFSGAGTTEAVMKFVHRLPRLGYPLVIDRFQLKGVPKKPGQLTISMSVAILNFRAWQEEKGA